MEDVEYDTAKVKDFVLNWTVVYALLFPFLAWTAVLSPMVLGSFRVPLVQGMCFVFLRSFLPLSIPVGIDPMWSHYLSGSYTKPLFFRSIPWVTFVFVAVISFSTQKPGMGPYVFVPEFRF